MTIVTIDAVLSYYDDPIRRYHTTDHLAQMVNLADLTFRVYDWSDQVNWNNLALAIMYHDAIYVPGAPDNEERSAELAEHELITKYDIAPGIASNVGWLIRGTNKSLQTSRQTESPTFRVLNDLDWSVVASGQIVYERYARAVRDEYVIGGGIDPVTYRYGRQTFLCNLMDENPFLTEEFKPLHTEMVVSNVKWELDNLDRVANGDGR